MAQRGGSSVSPSNVKLRFVQEHFARSSTLTSSPPTTPKNLTQHDQQQLSTYSEAAASLHQLEKDYEDQRGQPIDQQDPELLSFLQEEIKAMRDALKKTKDQVVTPIQDKRASVQRPRLSA